MVVLALGVDLALSLREHRRGSPGLETTAGVSPPASLQCSSSDLNRVAAFMVFSDVGAKLGLYSFN